ncbi:unnamed protein product, partial [Musa acuminata subsp. burmannicoides]
VKSDGEGNGNGTKRTTKNLWRWVGHRHECVAERQDGLITGEVGPVATTTPARRIATCIHERRIWRWKRRRSVSRYVLQPNLLHGNHRPIMFDMKIVKAACLF